MSREIVCKFTVALLGSATSFLFGGWSYLLQILVLFVAVDYVTGVLAAGSVGKINSTVGYWGIARKICIFLIVALAHQVDMILGGAHPIVFDAALFFYLANEAISIIENASNVGIPIPAALKRAIERIGGDIDG